MDKKISRYAIVFVLLLITSVLVFLDNRLSGSASSVKLSEFPLTLPGWKGTDFPVEERVQRILETESILSREYINQAGQRVLLSLVYYPDNKIGFHNPESCNVGVGSQITNKDVYPIPTNDVVSNSDPFYVNRLLLSSDKGNKVIFYFFVSDDFVTHDYTAFRLHMMKEQMKFKRASGAQIQVHSMIHKDLDSTMSTMGDFIDTLIPALLEFLP